MHRRDSMIRMPSKGRLGSNRGDRNGRGDREDGRQARDQGRPEAHDCFGDFGDHPDSNGGRPPMKSLRDSRPQQPSPTYENRLHLNTMPRPRSSSPRSHDRREPSLRARSHSRGRPRSLARGPSRSRAEGHFVNGPRLKNEHQVDQESRHRRSRPQRRRPDSDSRGPCLHHEVRRWHSSRRDRQRRRSQCWPRSRPEPRPESRQYDRWHDGLCARPKRTGGVDHGVLSPSSPAREIIERTREKTQHGTNGDRANHNDAIDKMARHGSAVSRSQSGRRGLDDSRNRRFPDSKAQAIAKPSPAAPSRRSSNNFIANSEITEERVGIFLNEILHVKPKNDQRDLFKNFSRKAVVSLHRSCNSAHANGWKERRSSSSKRYSSRHKVIKDGAIEWGKDGDIERDNGPSSCISNTKDGMKTPTGTQTVSTVADSSMSSPSQEGKGTGMAAVLNTPSPPTTIGRPKFQPHAKPVSKSSSIPVSDKPSVQSRNPPSYQRRSSAPMSSLRPLIATSKSQSIAEQWKSHHVSSNSLLHPGEYDIDMEGMMSSFRSFPPPPPPRRSIVGGRSVTEIPNLNYSSRNDNVSMNTKPLIPVSAEMHGMLKNPYLGVETAPIHLNKELSSRTDPHHDLNEPVVDVDRPLSRRLLPLPTAPVCSTVSLLSPPAMMVDVSAGTTTKGTDKLLSKTSRPSRVENMPHTDQYGDYGIYTGEVNEDGQPHGKGKMKYDNGVFYEGNWTNGSQDSALPRIRMLSGFTSWKGQPKQNKGNGGKGRCTVYGMDWIDFRGMSGKYTGDVNDDNVPDGKGIMKYDFGLIAEGEWIKGVLNNGFGEGQMTGKATIIPRGTIVPCGAGGTVIGGRMPVYGIPGGMSVIGGAGMSVVSGLGMMSISGNRGMVGRMPIMNPMINMMNNPFCGMGGGTMMPQVQNFMKRSD